MRLLTDGENPYSEKPKGWFGSDTEASIDHYAKREGFIEGAKAQDAKTHKADMKEFIELLDSVVTKQESRVKELRKQRQPLFEKEISNEERWFLANSLEEIYQCQFIRYEIITLKQLVE